MELLRDAGRGSQSQTFPNLSLPQKCIFLKVDINSQRCPPVLCTYKDRSWPLEITTFLSVWEQQKNPHHKLCWVSTQLYLLQLSPILAFLQFFSPRDSRSFSFDLLFLWKCSVLHSRCYISMSSMPPPTECLFPSSFSYIYIWDKLYIYIYI
jgi:hypothetical protein